MSGENEKSVKYDPFEHRNITHPTSTLGSFINLTKSSLGSGLLAMPAAFKNAGLIPGCIGTALVSFIATHCVYIFVRTSQELCQESEVPVLSYSETCETAFKLGPKCVRRFSSFVKHFADYAIVAVCVGGTSVYVVFVASSFKDVGTTDHFSPERKLSIQIYCIILYPLLNLITQLRYLKFLVPFSVLANVCLVATFGITLYYTMSDFTKMSDIKLVSDVKGWPLFVSTSIFAMEGINVVMPVENEMLEPRKFLGCPGVLNCTMILVAILYGVVGAFGYWKYGENVLGSITLNLPQDEKLALTAKVLVALSIFLTYALQMYAPIDIIWSRIKGKITPKYYNVAQIGLRSVVVALSVLMAVVVPDLELLIGIVGAILFSTLGLCIPIIVECVHKWDRGLHKWSFLLWKNVVLIMFYILVLVSGCYSSISEAIKLSLK